MTAFEKWYHTWPFWISETFPVIIAFMLFVLLMYAFLRVTTHDWGKRERPDEFTEDY